MLKKTIKYKNYNGVEVEEDFYFNLTETELTEWEFEMDGGLSAALDRLMRAQDIKQLMGFWKDVVVRAYGVKSPDGKRFIKSQEVRDEFLQSEAYNELFMELVEADKAVEFVNGLLPKNLDAFSQKLLNANKQTEQ